VNRSDIPENDPATDDSDAVSAAPNSVRRSRRRAQALGLLSLALVVLLIDQLSKNWVVANLTEWEAVPVLGEVLQWRFVRNPGAAFSFASGATWIFTTLAVVVVGAILWQARRLGSRAWALFFALLLGGVLGNLTDRLTREPGFPVGHVIDFISTPWLLPAIYNVADIAICAAMVIFVLLVLLGVPLDGSPRERRAAHSDADSSAEADSAAAAETETTLAADTATDADAGAADEPRA